MTNELEPCPFCGSKAISEPQIVYATGEYLGHLIYCENADCYLGSLGSVELYDSFEQAAHAWNARYKRTCNNKSKVIRKLICSRCGSETIVYKSASPLSESCNPNVCGYCGAEVVDGD